MKCFSIFLVLFLATSVCLGSGLPPLEKEGTLVPTKLIYLSDTYQNIHEGTLIELGSDTKGNYVILDETIFYPQGGGQASDKGEIRIGSQILAIEHVLCRDGRVLHFTKSPIEELSPGAPVAMTIDMDLRLLNSSTHTAGHLLDGCVHSRFPALEAFRTEHFLHSMYVEFRGELASLGIRESTFRETVSSALVKAISESHEVRVTEVDWETFSGLFPALSDGIKRPSYRLIEIDSFSPIPCGGTHLRNLSELRLVELTKIVSKKGTTRVSYKVH
ncbi:MAG: hypothetical protein K2Q34_00655 [Alphaproteobacteria bacterium]|nr:hypothetical protein [Alphaproteobacteria bacterium]